MVTNADFRRLFEIDETTSEVTPTMSIRETRGYDGKVIKGIKDLPTVVVQMNCFSGLNILFEDYARFPDRIEMNKAESGRYRIVQADTNDELEDYCRKSLKIVQRRSLADLLEEAVRPCPGCGILNKFEGSYCSTCDAITRHCQDWQSVLFSDD